MEKSTIKTIAILLLFFSIANYSFSQEVLDKAEYRFSYDNKWQFDTLKLGDTRDDLIILQVGRSISKSYSYHTFLVDSLSASPGGRRVLGRSANEAAMSILRGEKPKDDYYKRMRTKIYKNYPIDKMTVTDGINADYYIYTDQLNAQEWQIVDSTKTVLDYTCQMAVSDFRGRRWIAWFAPEIAISDGPWKLGGLPGLIMEAYDDQKHYHFTMVAIEKVDDEPIVFSPVIMQSGAHGRYQETTRLDFLRGYVRHYLNQNALLNAQLGRQTFDDSADGNTRHYDLIERDYR